MPMSRKSDIRKFIYCSFASLVALLPLIAMSLVTIFGAPEVMPDGSIRDGAQRGAGIFLYFFALPLLAIFFVYHLCVTLAANNSPRPIRIIFLSCFLTSVVLAVIFALFSYNSGLVFQFKMLLFIFISSVVCLFPAASVLAYLIHRHNKSLNSDHRFAAAR